MNIRSTFANAGLSLFAAASSWLASAHLWISLIGSVVAVAAGCCAILNYRVATRKTELDIDLLLDRCKNCADPDRCVFHPKHRPTNCKHNPS